MGVSIWLCRELASEGGEGSSFTVVGARRRRGSCSAAREEGRGRPAVTEMVLGRTDVAFLLSPAGLVLKVEAESGARLTVLGEWEDSRRRLVVEGRPEARERAMR